MSQLTVLVTGMWSWDQCPGLETGSCNWKLCSWSSDFGLDLTISV